MTARPRLEYARALLAQSRAAIAAHNPSAPALISLVGPVDDGLERRVRISIERAAGRAPALDLFVDSPGGYVDAARRIAHDLKQCGTPTAARAGALCESAATLPFLAAERRTARRSTKFLFHRATLDLANLDWSAVDAPLLREALARLEKADRENLYDVIVRGKLSSHMVAAIRGPGLRLDALMARVIGLVDEVTPRPTPADLSHVALFRNAPLAAWRFRRI